MKKVELSGTITNNRNALESTAQAALVASEAAAKASERAEAASVSAALISNDIGYIKKDIGEIKVSLKELTTVSITPSQHQEVVEIQKDHETRVRSLERTQTQILTWGSAGVLLLGVIEFVVQRFAH